MATVVVAQMTRFSPGFIFPAAAGTLTSLLLHCDGTNGATSFPDASSYNHTMTAAGSAQVNTTTKKFGTGSLSLNGTTGGHVDLSGTDDTAFQFGTGDWTIETFINLNDATTGKNIIDCRPPGGSGGYVLLFVQSGQFGLFVSGSNRIVAGTVTTATWYHLAIARAGTTTKMFQDGTQIGSDFTDSTNYLSNGANRPRIGESTDGGGTLNGFLDEIRFSKGIARYTANFTPPTGPFTSD